MEKQKRGLPDLEKVMFKKKDRGPMQQLTRYIKKHGKAKTAVALGLKETNAINNWISRDFIPVQHRDSVKQLKSIIVSNLGLREQNILKNLKLEISHNGHIGSK